MMRMRRNTLKQRLILIALVSAGIALLLAIAVMLASEATSFGNTTVRDISIKADIIGNQCTAALLFNVKKDAEETLEALRADPHIEYAAVYTKNGALFASYESKDAGDRPPLRPPTPFGYRFAIGHVDVTHPILLKGEQIGTVLIRTDLRNVYGLLLSFSATAAVVLALSMLVAYALVSKLQQRITGPVARLVAIMDRISREQDYAMRSDIEGPDELGSLARGFNGMLSTIQDREEKLEQQRLQLEKTVEDLRTSTKELQEANKKLENLDKIKSDFVSTVSHELRTPLTSIKAFAELLLLKPTMSSERQLKLLRTINEASERLSRLINDLLDLSRIESDTVKWHTDDVSMKDLIQLSVNGILPLAQNKGLRLTTELDEPIPSFTADRDRLVQVMTNILSNAIKFTPEGGAVTIAVHQEAAAEPRIVVAVTDTGIGIKQEDIEFIFDKFHRSGDTLTNRSEGTGLGLSIARQIVEHYGGRIWATSTFGKGSTFTFTLPLAGIKPPASSNSEYSPSAA